MRPPMVLILILAAVAVLGLFALRSRRPADAGQPAGRAGADAATGATPAPYASEDFATLDADRGILVHCGNSMRPAAEAIAGEFQRRTGIAVRFNFGGSAELLATIELGRQGDLYLCHDPYAEMLQQKGLLDSLETVGSLEPIIIVPPGNPRGIASVNDLVRPGLRLGMPDARYATAARMVREALRERRLEAGLTANLVMESRGHNDVAMAVLAGQLDAGIVWRFIAHFYWGRLDRIDLGLDIPAVKVTLCRLTTATEPEAARAFMDLAMSEFGQSVFKYLGYGPMVTADAISEP